LSSLVLGFRVWCPDAMVCDSGLRGESVQAPADESLTLALPKKNDEVVPWCGGYGVECGVQGPRVRVPGVG